jgi:surfactin synthase thioesterase subunit
LDRYKTKVGVEINLDGISRILSASSGLTRIIPAEYWRERVLVKPFEAYNSFAENVDVIVVNANNDEIVPKTDLKDLSPKIKVVALNGNHNFDGDDRGHLIEIIKKETYL